MGKEVDGVIGDGDLARRAWVVFCVEGEGEREIMPDAMLGLPMDLKTVSRVFSILRRDRVKISCFLYPRKNKRKRGEKYKRGGVGRYRRPSRTWKNASLCWILQKCIRGCQNCSVCRADLVRRLRISSLIVCKLYMLCPRGIRMRNTKQDRKTDLDPRVGLVLGSSLSDSSSLRTFLRESLVEDATEDAGRFLFGLLGDG